MLLHHPVQRGLLWAVALAVGRSAVRRTLCPPHPSRWKMCPGVGDASGQAGSSKMPAMLDGAIRPTGQVITVDFGFNTVRPPEKSL